MNIDLEPRGLEEIPSKLTLDERVKQTNDQIKEVYVSNIKDILTTISGIVLIIITAVKTYLDSLNGGDINWWTLVVAVVIAIVAYFTGKTADGKVKTPVLIAKQKELSVK